MRAGEGRDHRPADVGALPVVRLRGLTKRYGSQEALRRVDLDVLPGVTGLLGPNGAGKSTLIKLVLGLLRRDGGEGEVLGLPLGTADLRLRERVGYVPEEDSVLPLLSGVQSVAFAGELCGLPATESLRRAHEVLDFCGVDDERYRPAEHYSRGMRQKLKFAQAIVHDPQLLVLDEPTSGLDPVERVVMLRRLRALADEAGMHVLLSTHVLPDVQQVCDRIAVLAAGEVRLEGAVDELRRPARPETVVVTDGDAGPLLDALRSVGLPATPRDRDRIVVAGAGARVSAAVFEHATRCGLRVRSLRPGRSSMEEVFLRAVSPAADPERAP